MSNEKHTPLPWALHKEAARAHGETLTGGQHYNEEYVAVVAVDGTVIADNGQYYAQQLEPANAAFIVKAVNSHKALVDALEKSTAWIVQLAESGDAGFWDAAQMKEVKAARAALKLAKGAYLVQTFLPLPSFAASAGVLDRRRLGKQRVEAWQILQVLTDTSKTGWAKHPAVQQWRGHERLLAEYGATVCREWISRGYQDTMLPRFLAAQERLAICLNPWWLGCGEYHRSHQANLVRKEPDHYKIYFPWADPATPYFWPSQQKEKPE